MFVYRKIKVEGKELEAFLLKLSSKNLIVIRGTKGYIMCGYLNLKSAEKFGELAIKIVGVSNIQQALRAKVHSFTPAAKKLGIYKGQPIKEVLKLIA